MFSILYGGVSFRSHSICVLTLFSNYEGKEIKIRKLGISVHILFMLRLRGYESSTLLGLI